MRQESPKYDPKSYTRMVKLSAFE